MCFNAVGSTPTSLTMSEEKEENDNLNLGGGLWMKRQEFEMLQKWMEEKEHAFNLLYFYGMRDK